MNKILSKVSILLLSTLLVPLSITNAQVETQSVTKEDLGYKIKTFNSCSAVADEMNRLSSLVKKYDIVPYRDTMMIKEEMVMDMDSAAPVSNQKTMVDTVESSGGESYTDTNNQVEGIQEGDIIKTNGKYIYHYDNNTRKLRFFNIKTKTFDKEYTLPKSLYGTNLFINGSTLTLVSSLYEENKVYYTDKNNEEKIVSPYYYRNNTIVIVFKLDEEGMSKGAEKVSKINGTVSDVRELENKLYIISKEGMNLYNIKEEIKPDMIEAFLPKASLVEKNFGKVDFVKNKVQCSEIEYLIPSDESIKKGYINTSINIITTIDTTDLNKVIPQKVIFGNVDTLYMTHNNLYLTSPMYLAQDYNCSLDMCIMPIFRGGTTNTLLYKYNVNKDSGVVDYDTYNLIKGMPLNQYSMNEDKNGNFSIITQDNTQKMGVNVFSLDKDLTTLSKLSNVGAKEEFKSSRFIGDKLYLVTFERTDPFFVINMADKENIKIEGELKIPGYSTYLHPFDKNHLIGIGYDTKEMENGGIRNNGIKIDLYDVSDIKNPKQKYTKTIGTQGATSDVLYNPRMFMYKDNILAFPYIQHGYEKDTKAFQGAAIIKITSENGIELLDTETHINDEVMEKNRNAMCEEKFEMIRKVENKCFTTYKGEKICIPSRSFYIPDVCKMGSTLDDYKRSYFYQNSNSFIQRNLIIGNDVYSISSDKITNKGI